MVARSEYKQWDHKLLPEACPFCGSAPSGPTQYGGSDERSGYNFKVTIACKCGASMVADSHQGAGGWCNDTGQAMKAVVDAWNRRA